MATEQKLELIKPDVDNLNPLDAFYHIFTIDQHDYESDQEYEERLVARDTFVKTIEDAGMTPSEYLLALQQRYAN